MVAVVAVSGASCPFLLDFQRICAAEIAENDLQSLFDNVDAEYRQVAQATEAFTTVDGSVAACARRPCELEDVCLNGGECAEADDGSGFTCACAVG